MGIKDLIRRLIQEQLELLEEGKPKIPQKIKEKAEKIHNTIVDGTPPGQIPQSKQMLHLKNGKSIYRIELGDHFRMIYYKKDQSYIVKSHEDYNKWWKQQV